MCPSCFKTHAGAFGHFVHVLPHGVSHRLYLTVVFFEHLQVLISNPIQQGGGRNEEHEDDVSQDSMSRHVELVMVSQIDIGVILARTVDQVYRPNHVRAAHCIVCVLVESHKELYPNKNQECPQAIEQALDCKVSPNGDNPSQVKHRCLLKTSRACSHEPVGKEELMSYHIQRKEAHGGHNQRYEETRRLPHGNAANIRIPFGEVHVLLEFKALINRRAEHET